MSACSSAASRAGGATAGSTSPGPVAGPAPGGAAEPLTGSLTVFAPSSLTEAFDRAKSILTDAAPGLRLTYSFAGSDTLATQVLQGAPVDVVASADRANMQRLVAAGAVEVPVVFATNTLMVAVAPGNPRHLSGLADLARPGLTVVLAAPGVPAGDYARQALAAQHVAVTPASLETDVKAAVAKVILGEADAAVVYATDVQAAGPRVAGVEIPDAQNVVATYSIAVVGATGHRPAAEAFVRSAVSGDVRQAVRDNGFGPPT